MNNKKFITAIEFNKIQSMLAECIPVEYVRGRALVLEPFDDIDECRASMQSTTDAVKLLSYKGMPPFGGVTDVTPAVDRACKGATLTPRELLDVASLFRSARALYEYSAVNRTFETSLDVVFERLIQNKALEKAVFDAIITEDMIADEASTKLGDIRRNIKRVNNKIKEVLQRYTSGSYSRFLQDNIVTIRSGRYVVPVKAEHKNEIKGLVHDTSSSGATLFIEPLAVVEANNELRTLESAEKAEIDRILYSLSVMVATSEDHARLNLMNISDLAFAFGCGQLSARMNACEVNIVEKGEIILKKARHPLISKDSVVPVDVRLGGEYDTMVITGPNTGGKTVVLKTLGLFTAMALSGLHIPVNDGSVIRMVDNILPDIGDEQSIEQSLSTFSSHMVNIVSLLRDVTERSLVLFDELGVGTDPVEGAALAVSIIEEIRKKGALCAATTHYAELKVYALRTRGVTNANCEFDVDTLRPTYKLIIGTPGKSNAFAISGKLGLDPSIIENANAHIASDKQTFEDVIGRLEEERVREQKKKEELDVLKKEFDEYRKEQKKKLDAALERAKSAEEKAEEKARSIVESARMSSEYVFNELDKLRKAKNSSSFAEDLAKTRADVRKYLRDNESKIVAEEKTNENYVLPRPLSAGDTVLVTNIDKEGTVIEISGENVVVGIGVVKTKTKISNLRLVEQDAVLITEDKKKRSVRSFGGVDKSCSSEIDLRGKNGDEAWPIVDRYLDKAMLAGLHSVRLIHGKGTGALKNHLWGRLRSDSRISSYRIGAHGEGDGGVTVVELK